MKPKKWWKSKTLWFNAVSLAVIVAGAATDPSLVSPKAAEIAAVIVTAGNAVLRLFFTSQPIK